MGISGADDTVIDAEGAEEIKLLEGTEDFEMDEEEDDVEAG